MFKSRLRWEPLRTFNAATLNGSFQAIGTPLSNPSYILKMVNTSDRDVTISIDGATAIDVCPGGSFWLYDEYDDLPEGTQLFVNGAGGGTGTIYLVSQYRVR